VARRLKELPDAPLIIFGGANCEGEMGLQMVHSFPWVDYVCVGEGDRAFPEFLERLLCDHSSVPVPGIATAGDSAPTFPDPVKDLDSLPIPDYTDYFEELNSSPLRPELKIDLLIETSRGCWWGAKQHCTFCGLNGDAMAFRSKSPQRVFSELASLSQSYGLKRVECVDNILDMKYIPRLFDLLRDSGLDLELFYEVKANLRYEQLASLRAGGVRTIQPGIESFSNQVLRLMRKGCTALQNIQLLRWCEELDIQVAWNILAGFPAESPSEYTHIEQLVPLLTHLQPPAACCPVRLDRFSPFFGHAEKFGLARVRPAPAYFYVFPLGRKDLARLAYFFDFDYTDGRRPFDYIMGLVHEVQRWVETRISTRRQIPRLDAVSAEGQVVITDTRGVATSASHRLSGLAAEIYLHCDSAQGLSGLQRQFGPRAEAGICGILAELIDAKLLVEDEDHYLSLAVFRNRASQARIEQLNVQSSIRETSAAYPLLHVV
jgi:ribosomal peptide maturation radical SAM protein 1